jgi:hypothetical protein
MYFLPFFRFAVWENKKIKGSKEFDFSEGEKDRNSPSGNGYPIDAHCHEIQNACSLLGYFIGGALLWIFVLVFMTFFSSITFR